MLAGAVAAAALGVTSGLRAQTYPTRAVRILVPFGAGGAVDIIARVVAQELSPRLGQPVVVENRTGAGGNIAMEAVVRSPPDGYTLLMGSPSVTIDPSLYPNLTLDPATGLAPVALVGEVPSVLLAGPGLPAKDAREFVALAKARPGFYTFASGGIGTTEHLASELLKSRAGLDIVHVPYRGGAPALTDLIADRVSVMFINLTGALQHIQAGRVKVLAAADQVRNPAVPDVATLAEQGIPDFNVTVWWGVLGPAGMPAEVIGRLNREIVAALDSPEMRQSLERLSAKRLGGTPAAFGERLARERASWAEVIRSAGIRIEQ
jgi:tripartite-type tricarboxylate transporter receptor subunit TctC